MSFGFRTTRRRHRERTYCPPGRFLHRSLATGANRRHHAWPRRSSAPRQRALHSRTSRRRYRAVEAGRRSGARAGRIWRAAFRWARRTVSLHPAGHILGSSQVRIEYGGQVWVVSGDYKRQPDPTCAPFEPLECDVFISEATFALPVYRWPQTCRRSSGKSSGGGAPTGSAGWLRRCSAMRWASRSGCCRSCVAYTDEPVYRARRRRFAHWGLSAGRGRDGTDAVPAGPREHDFRAR